MKYIFGILLIVLVSIAPAAAQAGVTLEAEILDKSILREDATEVSVELKVRFTIRNNLDRPVIFASEDGPVCDSVTAGLFTKSDPLAHFYGRDGRPLHGSGAGPRSSPGKEYVAKVREELFVEPPPSAMTKVLAKDETIVFTKTQEFYFGKKTDPSSRYESWSTLLSFSPLDLYLGCSMFPQNLDWEQEEEDAFARALRAKWDRFGYLWLDSLRTAPIALDLRTLKAKSNVR